MVLQITCVIGKQLLLLSQWDTTCFEVAAAEIIEALGDLASIGVQWGHMSVDQANKTRGAHLLFLRRFSADICKESEVPVIAVRTLEQAWCGVGMILRYILQYCECSREQAQEALQISAPGLWAHLRCIVGATSDEYVREGVLYLVEFLLSQSIVPELVDDVLGVLTELLSFPQAPFWKAAVAEAAEAGHDGKHRRARLIQCLGNSVLQAPTRGLSSFSHVVLLNLEASEHIDVQTAVCKFYADLLMVYPAPPAESTLDRLVVLLRIIATPVRDCVVNCLQAFLARSLAIEPHSDHQRRDTYEDKVATDERSVGSPAKRPRLSYKRALHKVEHLVTILQDSICSAVCGQLSDIDMRFAMACLRVLLVSPGMIDWTRIMHQLLACLGRTLDTATDLSDPSEQPMLTAVSLSVLLIEMLADAIEQLPHQTITAYRSKISDCLLVPLQEDSWRDMLQADPSSELGDVITMSLRTLHLLVSIHGRCDPSFDPHTVLRLISSCRVAKVVIQAIKMVPFVITTAANLDTCFEHLHMVLSRTTDRVFEVKDIAEVHMAVAEAVGPLFCLRAATTIPHSESSVWSPRQTERHCQWKCCSKCDQSHTELDCRVNMLKYADMFARHLLYEPSKSIPSTCAFAGVVSRALNHMSVGDLKTELATKLVKSWLQLLIHPNKRIRDVLVRNIKVLAANQGVCIRYALTSAAPVMQKTNTDLQPDQADPDLMLLSHMEHLCGEASSDAYQSCLQAYGQLAQHMVHSKVLLAGVLKRLLIQIASVEEPPLLRVAAYEQIHEIALRKHGEKSPAAVNKLVQSVRDELYQGIVIEWFVSTSGSKEQVRKMITEITKILDRKTEEFEEELFKIALPKLVRFQAAIALDKMAGYLGDPVPVLVMQHGNFMKVLGEGLLHSPAGQHRDFLEYLSGSLLQGQVTFDDLVALIAQNQPDLIDIAVWELGMADSGKQPTPFSRGSECLKFVGGCIVPPLRCVLSICHPLYTVLKLTTIVFVSVQVLLQQQFPLVIERINSVINPRHRAPVCAAHIVWITHGSDQDGCHALRSLRYVIDLMGPTLKSFLPAVISTLKNVLARAALQDTALSVWDTLIRRVSAEWFGPYLSQIVGHLMELIQPFELRTVAILTYMLVERKHELKAFFDELPFLPRVQTLDEINASIDAEIGEGLLADTLHRVLVGVYNDSTNVRILALTRLKHELDSSRQSVVDLIGPPGSSVHRVIDCLVAALRRGCTDLNMDVKQLSMECFGELGAIDPGKLPADGVGADAPVTALNATSLRQLHKKYIPNMGNGQTRVLRQGSQKISATLNSSRLENLDLVASLISGHLVNVVKGAQDGNEYAKAAYSIQELLKLCGCSQSKERRRSRKSTALARQGTDFTSNEFWSHLQPDVQGLVSRFTTTKYSMDASVTSRDYPGFRECVRRSYQRWVRDWAYHLITQQQNFDHSPPNMQYYLACRAVVKMDMKTANFLLPYLVWDTICHGGELYSSQVATELIGLLQMKQGDAKHVVESQQILFSLLDKLKAWVDADEVFKRNRGKQKRLSRDQQVTDNFKTVKRFLAVIPKVDMARAALHCNAYQRALFCLEQELASTCEHNRSSKLNTRDLSFLQEIYSGLGEPDALAGVANLRSGCDTTLKEQIVDHEAARRWVDATTCYGAVFQLDSSANDDSAMHHGLMRCMCALGHFQAVLAHAESIVSRVKVHNDESPSDLLRCGAVHAADAAWRLSRWDVVLTLEKNHQIEKGHLALCVGSALRCLLELRGSDSAQVVAGIVEDCQRARRRISQGLSAACMESYERAYPMICQLHQLQELEHACRSFLYAPSGSRNAHRSVSVDHLLHVWDDRLRLTQPQLQYREPILALRRALLESSCQEILVPQVGKTWLQLARTARSGVVQTHGAASDQLHTAAGALLQSAAQSAELYHLERAKLLWAQNSPHQAVTELEEAIDQLGGSLPDSKAARRHPAHRSPSITLAKMQLLLGKYSQKTSHDMKAVLHHYKQAVLLQKDWDKGYFHLAQYLDMIYTEAAKHRTLSTTTQHSSQRRKGEALKSPHERLPDVINNYGEALCSGHKYIFQCLPRMLTLWFDFSKQVAEQPTLGGNTRAASAKVGRSSSLAVEKKVHALIVRFSIEMPTYQWFTALPQLISRTGHPNKDTQRLVKSIIATIVAHHPAQAVWMVVPLSKSKNRHRAAAAAQIMQEAQNKIGRQSDARIIQTASALIDELIQVCHHKTTDHHLRNGLCVSQHFPKLKQLLMRHSGRLPVIVPSQEALTIALPGNGSAEHGSNSAPTANSNQTTRTKVRNHNAFPQDQVTVSGVDENLMVLNSLMKPSRLTIIGSDGLKYHFLCKREEKGDMRKDSRLMEFNSMLNRLLQNNTDSRKRAIKLRTYAVLPLTEDCGLIEWVPNTHTLRELLYELYSSHNMLIRNNDIKKAYDKFTKGQQPRMIGEATKHEIKWFKEWAKPKFKPLFHKWLINTFPDPVRVESSCALSLTLLGCVLIWCCPAGVVHGRPDGTPRVWRVHAQWLCGRWWATS